MNGRREVNPCITKRRNEGISEKSTDMCRGIRGPALGE